MKSEIIIALVVLVLVATHVVLYRWVKFKIHEGVILRCLRDATDEGGPSYHTDAIAAHTELLARRVAVVCRKSAEIQSAPGVEDSWSVK